MRNRVVFGLALAIAVPALAFAQANVAGKWTGEVQGGRGPTPVTLELTVTGTAVTGKLTQGQGMPVDIQNAKLEGNKLTFSAPGGGGGGRGGGGGGGGSRWGSSCGWSSCRRSSCRRSPCRRSPGGRSSRWCWWRRRRWWSRWWRWRWWSSLQLHRDSHRRRDVCNP